MTIRAIVTDIEGTTSSIDFVHRILFPYSARSLPQYVRENAQKPEISCIIEQVRQEISQPQASIEQVIDALLGWIKQDKKITPLKTLQGFIWEDGYKKGEYSREILGNYGLGNKLTIPLLILCVYARRYRSPQQEYRG